MDDFPGFLLEVITSGAVSAVLVAVAAFLGKSHIAHWLSRSLEEQKARHQRELETYKVGLIAEAERAKSSAELKKAGALRVVDLRFTALDRYHKAFVAIRYSFPSLARLQAPQKTAAVVSGAHDLLEALRDAEHGWDLFLDQAEIQLTLAFRQTLIDHCLPYIGVGVPPIGGQGWQAAQGPLLKASLDVQGLIKKKLDELLAQ